MTNESPTADRALRYLLDHGVPAHIAESALTLHASEMAAFQRRAHDTRRPRFHMGLPCQPAYRCGVSAVIDLIDPKIQEES